MTAEDIATTRQPTTTTDCARIECNVCDAGATLNDASAVRSAEIATFLAGHQHPSDRGFRVCVRVVVGLAPTSPLTPV